MNSTFSSSPRESGGRQPRPRERGQSVWCPENLNFDDLRIAEGQRIAEGVLLLGHFVYEQLANDARCRDTGRVPLKASYLRSVIGRHHLDEVRAVAERIGYVARDSSYRVGYTCQKYRILEPYASARLVQREIGDAGLRQSLRAWREQSHRQAWDRVRRNKAPVAADVVEHLWQNLQRVGIDAEIDLGKDFPPAHQIAIDELRRGDFRISVDEYGRIHTNLTNLKTELRGRLTVDGERLENVDIGESQPLFLGLVTAMLHSAPNRRPSYSVVLGVQAVRSWEPASAQGVVTLLTGPSTESLPPSSSETSAREQERETEAPRGPAALMMDGNMLDRNMMDKVARLDWPLDRAQLPHDVDQYLALCEQRALYQTVADALGTTRDQVKRKVLAAFFDTPCPLSLS